MDYNAAFYIRLSKEDDSDRESESVANQRSLLRAFAQKHKLSVAGEYVDDGISGTTFDRPNFQRMIADIQAGKINMVLTKEVSRILRQYNNCRVSNKKWESQNQKASVFWLHHSRRIVWFPWRGERIQHRPALQWFHRGLFD
jgi:DNA invertase Pin-like site-specific DNA recombinase